jgi:hypothetical protein
MTLFAESNSCICPRQNVECRGMSDSALTPRHPEQYPLPRRVTLGDASGEQTLQPTELQPQGSASIATGIRSLAVRAVTELAGWVHEDQLRKLYEKLQGLAADVEHAERALANEQAARQ